MRARWLVLCIAVSLPSAGASWGDAPLDARVLAESATAESDSGASVTSGALDAQFVPMTLPRIHARGGAYWVKVANPVPRKADDIPVLVIHADRQARLAVFAGGAPVPLAMALPAFRGTRDDVYLVPAGIAVYARIQLSSDDARGVGLTRSTLEATLGKGAVRARMIDMAVGALVSMALAALLIWFVLSDRIFILYSTLFFLQSVYIAFLSGQAFNWPLLSQAEPLGSFAWNVPIGLSGAVACLFTREIASLKDFSPRAYATFGWLAIVFAALTVSNVAKLWGFVALVSAVGNIIFSLAAVFTLIVAFWSWRRGNRAAGWFLIAWGLLEGFTIAAAARFLLTAYDEGDALLYYGLPLSMVAAAVLIALGVADRLRQQRAALSDAERRAQTDPLTGVLNRRSLIERLDAACLRARARGLPIALLFIDLDHFKLINDTFGHQAGDACLRAIVGPIHTELRQSDVIGRYGGEEFVVILSSADAAAALPTAQRILERVAAIRVEGYGEPIALTCSIGVAASDALGLWGEQLLNRADAAVYAAKRGGRNQVHLAAS